ncbi:hypothetical protein EON82_10480 [bacterium]|nr:MAG: hypothetical protein EON82_10480 [bacterium]
MNRKLIRTLPISLLALPASWVLAQGQGGTTEVARPAQGAPAQVAPDKTAPAQGAPTKGGAAKPDAKGASSQITKGIEPGKTTTSKGAPPQGPGGMPGMPPPKKPAWKEFKLNPKTTIFLDYTEANPDAIISIFSRTSGITILKDPTFKVPLTVTSAKAVRLDEAFEIFNTVLGLNNYELQKQGNLMIVARKQPPQQPPSQPPPAPPQPIVKTYPLQNAAAAQVAKVITDIYGPAAAGGGQPQQPQFPGMITFGGQPPQMGGAPGGAANANFKVTSDEYSNSVIVKALPDEHTKIETLIKDLDKSTATPLVSELFTLKYIPAEQAVTAIEDLLTANSPTGRGAAKPAQPSYNDIFYYSPYGRQNSQKTAGGQSATAIRQTNSVNVNATKENMELVRRLIERLDLPAIFADNTVVVKLMNAKATDVADLLNKVFAQQRNPNQDGGFFFFSDFMDQGSSRNRNQNMDYGDNGEIVNTREITGKVNIQADPNTNSIVIVTQPSNMRMIRRVIEKLDSQVEQVVIETVIVEATLDKTSKLGVQYSFMGKLFGDLATGEMDFGLQTPTSTNQGLTYTLTGRDYKAFLNAINTDSRFKVLDTPRIFTSNNVKAEINVSQSVPYLKNQNITTGGLINNTADFLDVGVVLNVTPRITANGNVTMDVMQSADELQGFKDLGPNLSLPLTNKRKATTTVSVADGETVVLGGIIRHTERRNEQKVPILGDLPFLGYLFRSSEKVNGQSELMVFLTPHIVRTNEDAQRLRQKTTGDLTKPSQDELKKIVPPVPR